MAFADRERRLRVRANADNAEDALRARRFGAQGIGLCRTEHMFLGDRRELVERLILADTEDEREESLKALLPLQKQDFVELFEAMDGLPVTVRLLDPPLHEFLPDITELSVRVALAESRKDRTRTTCACSRPSTGCTSRTRCWGCAAYASAWSSPACSPCRYGPSRRRRPSARTAKGDPRAEIMIPLVGTVQELEIVREEADQVIAEVEAATGTELKLAIGTMIELPRAALTAGQIAEAAEFFSFGTNDLTQTVWGFSRDDVEASLLHGVPGEGHLRRLPLRDDRQGRRRLPGRSRRRGRPRHPPRPQARRLRRARRRPGVGPLLPRGGPRLRLLLAVPHPGGAAGGGPGGFTVDGQRPPLTESLVVSDPDSGREGRQS